MARRGGPWPRRWGGAATAGPEDLALPGRRRAARLAGGGGPPRGARARGAAPCANRRRKPQHPSRSYRDVRPAGVDVVDTHQRQPCERGFFYGCDAFVSVGGRAAFAQCKRMHQEWRRCLSSAAGPTDRSMSTAVLPLESLLQAQSALAAPIPRDSTVVVSRWQASRPSWHLRDFLTPTAKCCCRRSLTGLPSGVQHLPPRPPLHRAEESHAKAAQYNQNPAAGKHDNGRRHRNWLCLQPGPYRICCLAPSNGCGQSRRTKFVDKVLPSGKDRERHSCNKVEVADNLHALSLEHVSGLQRKVMQQSGRGGICRQSQRDWLRPQR